MRRITPDTIRPPFANYAHAVEVPPGARLLFASGQLGITRNDEIPEDAGAQADLCFANIAAVLEAAGMSPADVVRIDAFVSDRAHLAPYMAARDRFVTTPAPASTLMIVAGFAREAFKVEIEVIAAKVDATPDGEAA
ncbi:MAG: RidA family protein [Salinarimonas sp.]